MHEDYGSHSVCECTCVCVSLCVCVSVTMLAAIYIHIPYPPENKPPPLFDPQVLAQVCLPQL